MSLHQCTAFWAPQEGLDGHERVQCEGGDSNCLLELQHPATNLQQQTKQNNLAKLLVVFGHGHVIWVYEQLDQADVLEPTTEVVHQPGSDQDVHDQCQSLQLL